MKRELWPKRPLRTSPAAWRHSPQSAALFCVFRQYLPGPSHLFQNFLVLFCLSFSCPMETLRSKLAVLIRGCHLDNHSGR